LHNIELSHIRFIGLEFWDLAEISAAYFKDFRMTEARTQLVLNVVNHIMREHHWTVPAPVPPSEAQPETGTKKKDKKKKKKGEGKKKKKKAEDAAAQPHTEL
jgi:hypothetical protein